MNYCPFSIDFFLGHYTLPLGRPSPIRLLDCFELHNHTVKQHAKACFCIKFWKKNNSIISTLWKFQFCENILQRNHQISSSIISFRTIHVHLWHVEAWSELLACCQAQAPELLATWSCGVGPLWLVQSFCDGWKKTWEWSRYIKIMMIMFHFTRFYSFLVFERIFDLLDVYILMILDVIAK